MGIYPRTLVPKFKWAYRRLLLIGLICSSLVIFPFTAVADFRVTKVVDGDTIRLGNGKYVRFLQISAPEINKGHCYAQESQEALASLISGSKVTLELDSVSSNLDRYNRKLRYVYVDDKNLNLEMIRIGAAAPWFFNGERGKYSKEMISLGKIAFVNKIGLWAQCPEAKLDPTKELFTGFARGPSPSTNLGTPSASSASPGSYCKEAERGQERLGKNGILYTCKVSESENRLRWRK